MLTPEAAWRRLEPWSVPLAAVALPRQAAAGMVLARAVAASVDLPASDVSAMDGFALAGEPPLDGGPLPIAGRVVAGDPPGRELPAGTVLRIMTGAPVPHGADRVIPVEQAAVEALGGGPSAAGDLREEVRFAIPGAAGDHIRRRGEVVRRGETLLAAGSRLTPGALALLAAHGHARFEVVRTPRVALVVTGDEVVPTNSEPAPGQLRDSHGDFVQAACRALGVAVEHLGIAPDRPEELSALLRKGLAADVLLVSGGVSMGELDLVAGALADLGAETLFHGVAVQPGKPLLAALGPPGSQAPPGRRTLIFGLPGNPASVMACFWLFVRPALRRLAGRPDGFWHGAVRGVLTAPLPGGKAGPGGRDRFLPATVAFAAGVIEVTPLPPAGSHDLRTYAAGSALVRIPAGAPPRAAGAACEMLPLVDWGDDTPSGDGGTGPGAG